MAKTHPHKGYLNTEFHFYANGTETIAYEVFSIENQDGNLIKKGSFSPNIPHSINLPEAGSFRIKFSDGSSSDIIIEDGYRFGGSKHKTTFVFDDSPWIFVVMHDRTYFYNRESKEEYVEAISPDSIKLISKDYVVFSNIGQQEQSIYSLIDQCPILTISGIIFSSENGIVWIEECDEIQNIKFFNFSEKRISSPYPTIIERVDYKHQQIVFTHDNKIYRIDCINDFQLHNICEYNGTPLTFIGTNHLVVQESHMVYLLNTLTGNVDGSIEIDGVVASINKDQFITVRERYVEFKNFDISSTPIADACISCKYNEFNIYHCDWGFYCTLCVTTITKTANNTSLYTTKLFKALDSDLCQNIKNINGKVIITPNRLLFYNNNEYLIINPNWNDIKYSEIGAIYQHKEDVVLYKDNTIFKLNENGAYWDKIKLYQSDYDFDFYEDYGIIKDIQSEHIRTIKGRYDLGKFIKHDSREQKIICSRATVLLGGKIIWGREQVSNKKAIEEPDFLSESKNIGINIDKEGVTLLTLTGDEYRSELILKGLYDNQFYHDVLFSINGSQIMYRNASEIKVLDIDTGSIDTYENMSYIKHINGIRPHFEIPSSLQPRLINPVTKQIIDCNSMSKFQFISPNGMLYADTRLQEYIEYYWRNNNHIISRGEYLQLIKRFQYPWPEKRGSKLWKKVKDLRKAFILEHFGYMNEKFPKILHNDRTSKRWEKCIIEEEASDFLGRVIGQRGIAYIRHSSDNSVAARLELGEPLTYINYVSFSYDAKYVALAGYRSNQNGAWGGLFLIYDLENKTLVASQNTNRAVWLTAFSRSNALSSYTSDPTTFLASSDNKYNEDFKSMLINQRNFLTFSPDGNYFALSNQGYVSKYNQLGEINIGWGHQPSSLVEVRTTNEANKRGVQFNDLSDRGIADVACRAACVASVSFSNDNKRLMMVGNDGVVIIRNLHLEQYANK